MPEGEHVFLCGSRSIAVGRKSHNYLVLSVGFTIYYDRIFIQGCDGKDCAFQRGVALRFFLLCLKIPFLKLDATSADLFLYGRSIIAGYSFRFAACRNLLYKHCIIGEITDWSFCLLYCYCAKGETESTSIFLGIEFIPGYQIICGKLRFPFGICFKNPGTCRSCAVSGRICIRLLSVKFYCELSL